MKNSSLVSIIFGLIFLIGSIGQAQVDLISVDEFAAEIKSNDALVIVDANKTKNYQNSHVKNAVQIYHNDLYKDGEIKGLIESPEVLAAFFGEKGIAINTPVVIYDDGSQKYSTRVYWILKYMGAENVRILHRDLDQWRKARIPLTTAEPAIKPVVFTPNINPAIFADLNDVKNAENSDMVMLIDCRTEAEFTGADDKSEGHIPGAIHLNYEEFLTETGAFKTMEEIMAIAEAKGITKDKELILYCATSVRAAVEFVVFKNILGYENVRVYDGAYNEWINDNPVVQ